MRQARPDQAAPEWQIWVGLLIVYIVWGSTYLAIRVVVGTMPPLLSAGVRFVFRERVAIATVLGVLIGFAGVAVLVVPRGIDGSVAVGGMLLLLLAPLSWSIGTFYSKRVDLPGDYMVSTAAQMLVGGAALLAVGVLVGELGLVKPENFSTDSLLALAYLIVFGSVIAYTAYTWLLQHAPVSRVATYAFVNPVVAIILGTLLLNEEINATMVIGAAMIVVAVAVVVRTESQTPKPNADVEVPSTPAAIA